MTLYRTDYRVWTLIQGLTCIMESELKLLSLLYFSRIFTNRNLNAWNLAYRWMECFTEAAAIGVSAVEGVWRVLRWWAVGGLRRWRTEEFFVGDWERWWRWIFVVWAGDFFRVRERGLREESELRPFVFPFFLSFSDGRERKGSYWVIVG